MTTIVVLLNSQGNVTNFKEKKGFFQMARTLRVIQCKVGQAPEVVMFDTSYDNMKNFIGGYPERVSVGHGIVAMIDEEGLLKEKEPNIDIGGNVLVGDLFFVGEGMVEGDIDFLDLSEQQIEIVKMNVNFNTQEKAPEPFVQHTEFGSHEELVQWLKGFQAGGEQ